MAHATTAPGHRGPRRRAVLAGWLALPPAVALLDGCGAGPPAGPAHRAAQVLLQQAAQDSTALLAQYDAVAAARPALAERLRPLRSQVAEHLAAFEALAGGGRRSAPAAGRSGPPSASPPSAAASPAALAAEEQRIAAGRTAALVGAAPEPARLLASAAAAGACHVLALRALQGGA